jgi:hypothetical protein
MAQWRTGDCRKDRIRGVAFPLRQPSPKNRRGVFTKRSAAEFSAFSLALYIGGGTEHDILATQTHEFRGAQAGLHRQQQHGPIPASDPCAQVRDGKQGGHFLRIEEGDWPSEISLAWHSENSLRQCAVFW